MEEAWREYRALPLSVVFWVHGAVVLQEPLLALAAWEVSLVPALVATIQVELGNQEELRALVEAEAMVAILAYWVPSDPLLVLLESLETP